MTSNLKYYGANYKLIIKILRVFCKNYKFNFCFGLKQTTLIFRFHKTIINNYETIH